MKSVAAIITEGVALARQSGFVLTELQLPRDEFDALKDECREFALSPLSEEERYRFVYEPTEKIIYQGVEVTPTTKQK